VEQFVAQIAQRIAGERLFSRRQKILVAVSGGVDSIVLLKVLHELSNANSWKLAIAHFNHRLRGAKSDRDAEHVNQTALKLDLPFFLEDGDVAAAAASNGDSIEMAARQARHRFLAETAKRWRCRKIALAHHADDQVELFFLRLLRGAGIEGLTGMQSSAPSPEDPRYTLTRPLLHTSRAEIENYAREQKIKFREDASNRDVKHERNRIRHELLPSLRRDYQPALDQVIRRTMHLLDGERELADCGATHLERSSIEFDQLPVGFRRRTIRDELIRLGINPNFELVNQLLNTQGEILTTPGGRRIARTQATLTIVAPAVDFDEQPSITVVPGNTAQSASIWSSTVKFRVIGKKLSPGTEAGELFDFGRIGPKIIIRTWKRGDRYQPIGMKESVKLQDCFVNQKIPKNRRHRLLIATTAEGDIFWVEGLRIGELGKIRRNTRRTLEWNCR
jgi:tRNA(Ile)-lysidine synthase